MWAGEVADTLDQAIVLAALRVVELNAEPLPVTKLSAPCASERAGKETEEGEEEEKVEKRR